MGTGFGMNIPKTYFKIKEGHIVFTVPAGKEQYNKKLLSCGGIIKPIKNKEGQLEKTEVWVNVFAGWLQRIELYEGTFNNTPIKSWNIVFAMDDGSEFVWSAYYDGSVTQSFINALSSEKENLGLITLKPYTSKKSGNTMLAVENNGHALEWKYQYVQYKEKDGSEKWKLECKETGEKVPELIPLTYTDPDSGEQMPLIDDKTGKQQFSSKKRNEFFTDLIEKINKKINGAGAIPAAVETSADAIEEDVPF